MPKDERKDLLAGVDKDNVEVVVRVLEQAKIAVERWEVIHSDFLTPPAIDDALKALKRLADVGVVVSGGYTKDRQSAVAFLLDTRKQYLQAR